MSQPLSGDDFGRDELLLLSSAINFANTKLSYSRALDQLSPGYHGRGSTVSVSVKAMPGRSGPDLEEAGSPDHSSLPLQLGIHSTNLYGALS